MNEKGERAREEAWAMVAIMVGIGALGTVVGLLLDILLGTRPWLLLVGAVLGLGAGLFLMLRSGVAYAHRDEQRR